jgi:hypothetical protein
VSDTEDLTGIDDPDVKDPVVKGPASISESCLEKVRRCPTSGVSMSSFSSFLLAVVVAAVAAPYDALPIVAKRDVRSSDMITFNLQLDGFLLLIYIHVLCVKSQSAPMSTVRQTDAIATSRPSLCHFIFFAKTEEALWISV